MIVFAVTAITLALVFYTIGVWSEKVQRSLKKWHLAMFWTGFVFDTTGTTLMSKIAGSTFSINFHSMTGLLAILLMAVHAIWATSVLIKGGEVQKRSFHKFSILVWAIWLVPFVSGMIIGMMH